MNNLAVIYIHSYFFYNLIYLLAIFLLLCADDLCFPSKTKRKNQMVTNLIPVCVPTLMWTKQFMFLKNFVGNDRYSSTCIFVHV